MKLPLAVLIVEDSEDDVILITRALRRGGYDLTFEQVDTPEAMRAALARQAWDVVIADYTMPHFSGQQALALLREGGLDLPFILVSGTIGEQVAVEAMKAGAHDYLMKDNLARLVPAVRRELREAEVRLARKRAEDALRQRNRELALLYEAGQAFNSTLDLDQVLAAVLEEMRRLLNVAVSSIWLLDPETNELVCREATGPRSQVVRGWRLAPGEGLAGWVAQNGQSVIVADAWTDARHFGAIDQQTGLPLRSFLSVPLQVRDRVIGVLQLTDTQVDRFRQTDLPLAESLAATAAVAIENARMFVQEGRRAAALARALEQQRELDRLKSELLQNLSHELRTPLAIARGYAELLSSGELGELRPEQREPVAIIAHRTQMLSKMMDGFTALLDVKTNQLRQEQIDLGDLVHKVLADFGAAVEQAGLTLTAQVAPDLPPVLGDAIQLQRVVDNLLDNALKFTPAGGHVSVRLDREGENVVLEVADTGVGIPADQLERIFERFYQVDGSMSRRYGGVGLGLALVKEVVAAYDGAVSVESQLGQGSTFRICLPAGGEIPASE